MPRPKKPPVRTVAPPDFPTWEVEADLLAEGWECVAGVDEAGRGPLAGPVVAAAVILRHGTQIPGLRDSKVVSAPVREELYVQVVEAAICWSVGLVEAEEIDRINILQATHRAMAEALIGLSDSGSRPHGALVDGLPVRGLPVPHRAVVRGDAKSVSIAAAAIVAKVTRDRLMVEWDHKHPEYGFARHKGYSTPEHIQALLTHGPCPCHRRSFRPVLNPELSLPLFAETLDD